jgi:hypothetical protein
MSTYGGEAQQLAMAQEVIDQHAVSSADGRCLGCGVPGPCVRHLTAVVVFRRFDRLPRHRAGQAGPQVARG